MFTNLYFSFIELATEFQSSAEICKFENAKLFYSASCAMRKNQQILHQNFDRSKFLPLLKHSQKIKTVSNEANR